MSHVDLENIEKRFSKPKKQDATLAMFSMIAGGTPPQEEIAGTDGEDPGEFAIENLGLEIVDGQTLVILGPSGCGKTTLLRIIAGLEAPDRGRILFDGADVTQLEAKDRGIGMVFQNYALFPHLNVKTNILSNFFFRKKKEREAITPEMEQKFQRTAEMLGVDIAYLYDRSPAKLSGGEKQRVALGRCITREPTVFLMDEPFSNLDAKLRSKYRLHLRRLLQEFAVTTVYVTHDQQEALILADQLAIMRAGRIVQTGSYEDIYNEPADVFVADFLDPEGEGCAINLLEGRLVAEQYKGNTIGVRPAHFGYPQSEPSGQILEFKVAAVQPLPMRQKTRVVLELGGKEYIWSSTSDSVPGKGDRIRLTLQQFHVFDNRSEKRLETVVRQ